MRKLINEAHLPELTSLAKQLVNGGRWSLFYKQSTDTYLLKIKDLIYTLNNEGTAIHSSSTYRLNPNEVKPVLRVR